MNRFTGERRDFFSQNSKEVPHWKFSTVRVPPLGFWLKNSWRSPAKSLVFLYSAWNFEAKTPNKIAVIARRWNSCPRIEMCAVKCCNNMGLYAVYGEGENLCSSDFSPFSRTPYMPSFFLYDMSKCTLCQYCRGMGITTLRSRNNL